VLAVAIAGGLVVGGWALREAVQENPASVRWLLPSAEEPLPVRAQPGGLARLLTSDLMTISSVAWAPDGGSAAICAMPSFSMGKLMQQAATPTMDPRQAQERQRQMLRDSPGSRLFLLDLETGNLRRLESPPDSRVEAENVVWLPGGRLAVITTTTSKFNTDSEAPAAKPEYQLWLVDPAEESWDKLKTYSDSPLLASGPKGVAVEATDSPGHSTLSLLTYADGKVQWRAVLSGRLRAPFWGPDGNLYARELVKDQPTTLWRCPVGDAPQKVPIHAVSGPHRAPLVPAEMLVLVPRPGGKGSEPAALNVLTGAQQLLTDRVLAVAPLNPQRLLGGGWVLLRLQVRGESRGSQLAALRLADGKILAVTEVSTGWEALSRDVAVDPAGERLLYESSMSEASGIFSGLRSPLWLLQLSERQLLSAPPLALTADGHLPETAAPTKGDKHE
jgi:hypothetical protein